MRLKWAVAAAVTVGFGLALPAHAQELEPTQMTVASELTTDGFRVAEGTDGFLLVEHGIWRKPPTASSEPPATDAGRTYLPYRYPKPQDSAPSGFRRASYLPHVYAAEAQYSLPSGLLDALVWTESRYNPMAISKAGAAGLGSCSSCGTFDRSMICWRSAMTCSSDPPPPIPPTGFIGLLPRQFRLHGTKPGDSAACVR